MPNWCFNRLEVSKHNESGRRLIDAFRENHVNDKGEAYALPFQDLRPCPEELLIEKASGGEPEVQEQRNALYKANIEKYGFETWYEWRLANWGTKWEACEVDITDEDDSTAVICFDTAWCPPTELLAWYAKQHPDVRFRNEYDEEGCSFEGYDENTEQGFVSKSWEPEQDLMED